MDTGSVDNWPRRRALQLRDEERALLELFGIQYHPPVINGVWMLWITAKSFCKESTPPFPNLEEFQRCAARLWERANK